MQGAPTITVVSNRSPITISSSAILYILMNGKNAEIHVLGGKVYGTRTPLSQLEQQLGNSFIKIHRGCLVSVMSIHNVTDSVNLSNGESLIYTLRKRKKLIAQLQEKQRLLISSFDRNGVPATLEAYRSYYQSFEHLPFAFTDIEMIFSEENHAVDWIFRYGNPALARLERLPLEQLIGSTFSSLFSNMDSKWLHSYERATLYGEIREIIDYSPEIDTYLKVICFPTFKGHCGCILFDVSQIKFTRSSADTEKALLLYLGRQPK